MRAKRNFLKGGKGTVTISGEKVPIESWEASAPYHYVWMIVRGKLRRVKKEGLSRTEKFLESVGRP